MTSHVQQADDGRSPPGEALAVLMGMLPLLPHYVEPAQAAGFRAHFDLRLRGAREARAVLAFEDGPLTVEQPDGVRADCYVSADPAVFTLVASGRIKPLGPALRGKIVTWAASPVSASGCPASCVTPDTRPPRHEVSGERAGAGRRIAPRAARSGSTSCRQAAKPAVALLATTAH